MAKSPLRPPPEVVHSIDQQSVKVRTAAAELTNRIVQFQEYLGSLPGRVETTAFGSHPEVDNPYHDDRQLAIYLHRDGKPWVLSWATYHPQHDSYDDWQPLKDAPLKIKIAAMRIFPNFLEAIERSQVVLAEQLNKAVAEFDAFAKSLTKTEKERE